MIKRQNGGEKEGEERIVSGESKGKYVRKKMKED